MSTEQYKAYTAKSGRQLFKPSIALVEEMDDYSQGFCLACANIQEGCEPDARKYECECCGEPKVYGGAELAFMGLVF